MLTDAEITFHIRRLVEYQFDESFVEEVAESVNVLTSELDAFAEVYIEGQEVPAEIQRMTHFWNYLSGEPASYTVEPQIVVSQIIANFEHNPTGGLDMMPVMQGISLAADWDGEAGSEPAWLVELDQLLMKHHYDGYFEFLEYTDGEIIDFKEATIVERAKSMQMF